MTHPRQVVRASWYDFPRYYDVAMMDDTIEEADFTESQLLGMDFSKCALGRARFTGACLYDAKLRQASGAGCDFSGANLKRAILEEA